MKYILSLFILSFLLSCQNQKNSISINSEKLLLNLKAIAHDSTEGRFFGTEGNKKTQIYLAKEFEKLGAIPAFENSYIQEYPYTFKGKRRQRIYPIANPNEDFSNVPDTTVIGGNVAAYLKGKTDKTIVITGHLDHLGIRKGKIYNGADDDASGTAALLAMVEYFKNKQTKHSLVFAAVDAEEIGSLGADYLLKNFPMDTAKITMNINMDMIAHSDSTIYASGLYHYPKLKKPLDDLNTHLVLKYGHDDPNNDDLDDWTNSSDHRIFHRAGIPFIYFGVEDHKDYHKHTDTFDTINQEFYVDAVEMIIQAIENYDAFLD
ncbi:MAG: hypothetical protein BM563_03580 [Bacteroidetes bacterium MedPE-SWsnd-G1]|nr:MAG: hypothetical protein BM563_03580 [Bacteroidetes bacterium MedPE-SWsnd-G1]